MKENQAGVASSNTRNPPPTNDNPAPQEPSVASRMYHCTNNMGTIVSSSKIKCNQILMGSSCRAAESFTVVDRFGRRHVACCLFDSGGSTSLVKPSFSERAHMTKTTLDQSFTICTETSRETVAAVRLSFHAEHSDGVFRAFEALNGSSHGGGDPVKFCLIPVPKIFQRTYSLPEFYESPQDNHHITLAVDCQHLQPQPVAFYENVVVGISQVTGRYICWTVGSSDNMPTAYSYDEINGDGSSPDNNPGPGGPDSGTNSHSAAVPTTFTLPPADAPGTQETDDDDDEAGVNCSADFPNDDAGTRCVADFPGDVGTLDVSQEPDDDDNSSLEDFLYRPHHEALVASTVTGCNTPLSSLKDFNINPLIVGYNLLNQCTLPDTLSPKSGPATGAVSGSHVPGATDTLSENVLTQTNSLINPTVGLNSTGIPVYQTEIQRTRHRT